MKYFFAIILITLFVLPLMAQQETLLRGEIESGWHGGALFKLGSIMSETGYFAGLQGGWIINHRIVLGGKGYILLNPARFEFSFGKNYQAVII